VMPPTPLLPMNDRLAAADAAPADAAEVTAILKEDGLNRRERRTIRTLGNTSSDKGWVEAYQFDDATGALAAFTYFRQGARARGGSRVNTTEVQLANGEVVFLDGVTVVRAASAMAGEPTDALLKEVQVGLPKVGGRRGLAPLLPAYLPANVAGTKLDAASERYAVGPAGYQAMGGVLPAEILGWDKSAEAITATYAVKGTKGTLTLLLYPTPQIAGDRGRAIEKAINDRGAATFGTVKLRRVGPLIGMTSGGLTAEQAEKLVQALHLNEEVSFDKKMPLEFHAEVRKTATLLQQIAIFTGVLILAAVVIAVFLGGARAGIRVMRGKSAASEPEFLTINLRDKPKALFTPKEPGTPKGPDKSA